MRGGETGGGFDIPLVITALLVHYQILCHVGGGMGRLGEWVGGWISGWVCLSSPSLPTLPYSPFLPVV